MLGFTNRYNCQCCFRCWYSNVTRTKFFLHCWWMLGYGQVGAPQRLNVWIWQHPTGHIPPTWCYIPPTWCYIPPTWCYLSPTPKLPSLFSLAHRFHFLCLPNSQSSNPFQVKATNEERVIETEVWFDFSAFQLVRNLLVVTSFQKLPLPLNPS